ELEIVRDVAQREAEPLAAQDQDEPGAVAAPEHAGRADALRGDQPLGLVEPDGARRDAEFAGEVGDGVEVAVFAFKPVHGSVPCGLHIPRAVPSWTACRSGFSARRP